MALVYVYIFCYFAFNLGLVASMLFEPKDSRPDVSIVIATALFGVLITIMCLAAIARGEWGND